MHPGTLLEHSMKYRIDQFSLNHKTIENLDITDRWRWTEDLTREKSKVVYASSKIDLKDFFFSPPFNLFFARFLPFLFWLWSSSFDDKCRIGERRGAEAARGETQSKAKGNRSQKKRPSRRSVGGRSFETGRPENGSWLKLKTKLTRRCWELTQIKSGRRNHLGSVVDDQQLTSPLASLPPNFQLDVWRRLASSRNCTAFAPPSTVPFRLMNLFFSFWSAPTRWSHCFHLLLAPCRS